MKGAAAVDELKPCPFCGSAASFAEENPLLPNGQKDSLYYVHCSLRECGARTMSWYPHHAARDAWNRRSLSPCDAEAVREACAKMVEKRGADYVKKWFIDSLDDANEESMSVRAKAYAWDAVQHAAAIRSLDLSPFRRVEEVVVPREPNEAMVNAPRQIILYAETRGRNLRGLREHLDMAGVDYSYFPNWAKKESGHLTKAAIVILIYKAMLAAAKGEGKK